MMSKRWGSVPSTLRGGSHGVWWCCIHGPGRRLDGGSGGAFVGADATQGRAYAQGMKLYFDQVNKAGGVQGNRLSWWSWTMWAILRKR